MALARVGAPARSVEPDGIGERHNLMIADTVADTGAIRTLGTAHAAHAAELDTIAATLRSTPSPAAALGPVGSQFLAAYTAAVAGQSARVAELGERVRSAGMVAANNAASFDAAGQRAAELLPRL